jgi:hypothetical protein
MQTQIDNIKKVRIFLLDLVKDLSTEQVNKTLAGFNNNIVWNLGHLIAAQQGVCYTRTGIKPVVEDKYISPYKSGTEPGEPISEDELSAIKDVMLSSLDQLQRDYDNNAFSDYAKWSTRYGVELASIEDAIGFLGFHEGLHMGTIIALKKMVIQ